MKKLNRKWRGKNKPTDVLSFPQWEKKGLLALARVKKRKGGPPINLGDIVISWSQAKIQALDKNFPLSQELDWLLVHGILHLLAFDHELSEREAQKMWKMERLLLGDKAPR